MHTFKYCSETPGNDLLHCLTGLDNVKLTYYS